MKKHFSIPRRVVPTEEQVKSQGIKEVCVMNDPVPFVRPVMTIEYAELNDRVSLKHKIKHKHVVKPIDSIKGVKPILKKLEELCMNTKQL